MEAMGPQPSVKQRQRPCQVLQGDFGAVVRRPEGLSEGGYGFLKAT